MAKVKYIYFSTYHISLEFFPLQEYAKIMFLKSELKNKLIRNCFFCEKLVRIGMGISITYFFWAKNGNWNGNGVDNNQLLISV